MSPWFLWYGRTLTSGDDRQKLTYLKISEGSGWTLDASFFLAAFASYARLSSSESRSLEFLLDCLISREVYLFLNTTLSVLLLCHSFRNLHLVFFGKHISSVDGAWTLRSDSGSGRS